MCLIWSLKIKTQAKNKQTILNAALYLLLLPVKTAVNFLPGKIKAVLASTVEQSIHHMNIFLIPSWYPSVNNHLSGIFTKEQAVALAEAYPSHNVGISLWGQKSESNLLWAKDHFKNLKKLFLYLFQKPTEKALGKNCLEFYSPALTWTNSLLEGNIKNIIRANEQNLQMFEARFGKATLIHAHVAFPAGYIAMQLARKYGLPYIITEHMSPFPLPSFLKIEKRLSRIKDSLQHAQFVISVSPHAAADIKQKTGVQPLCIPNLVNETLFTHLQVPPSSFPFTFFTLCGLLPQKGIPDLLKAIALLDTKEVVFRIGGEGEYAQEYKQLAEALKVSHKIHWLGELSRIEAAEEFQKCHTFVLPSIHESMGVVYAEAVACGKPIIATRCGGPEFIVNQENGLLVEVNSPEQLAGAMSSMIKNYNQYQPETIRKDFLARFSSAVITKKIFSVYEAVASKKPLPPELFHNE